MSELGAGQLSAVIEPKEIQMGESARLTLNFENVQPREIPVIPDVPNLQITYTGMGRTIQLINGQQSSIVSFNYAVVPTQPGEYTIPSIKVTVGKEVLSSEPVTLKVLREGAQGSEQDARGRVAFITITPAKTNVYIGEVLTLEIRLYHAFPAQDLQLQPLTGDGFTFGKTQELPQRRVRLGNTVYFLRQLQTTAVANKVGELKINEVECSGRLEVPVSRRRTGDIFDDFFADSLLFGRYEVRPMRVRTDPVTIRVLPLPDEGKPPGFAGAVGQFALSVVASPTNVAVGEPIRIQVRVDGRGALENINPPQLDSWTDFATYPPVSNIETTDALGIVGSRVFQYDVVPQKLTIRSLPRIELAYFDPEEQKYRVLSGPEIPIVVRPGRAGISVSAARDSEVGERGQDIVHLKARVGVCSTIGPPLVKRTSFLVMQGLPILLWLGAVAMRKRREHLAHNPHLLRKQEVNRAVKRGLTQLARYADAHDSEQFFALTFRLLQEQLGERLGLPAAAITDAVVEEHLKPRGAPADVVALVTELFAACNQQRYAPSAANEDLRLFLPKVEFALKQIRSLNFGKE
ncbi:MAG: BatD family protein [Verrucomicrobiae bacterium]|nr:BatD family protein [Verrucomicrobiae bacterium]